jgi:hypothetical protein
MVWVQSGLRIGALSFAASLALLAASVPSGLRALPSLGHTRRRVRVPSGMQTLGLAGSFRGHEGRTEALNKIFEVWGSELEPAYMLDLGDRVLNLGFWHTQARASGVQLDQEFAQLSTMRDGLVFRDQIFFSWEEGLRAAGLEPDAIALPVRGKTSQAASSAG